MLLVYFYYFIFLVGFILYYFLYTYLKINVKNVCKYIAKIVKLNLSFAFFQHQFALTLHQVFRTFSSAFIWSIIYSNTTEECRENIITLLAITLLLIFQILKTLNKENWKKPRPISINCSTSIYNGCSFPLIFDQAL